MPISSNLHNFFVFWSFLDPSSLTGHKWHPGSISALGLFITSPELVSASQSMDFRRFCSRHVHVSSNLGQICPRLLPAHVFHHPCLLQCFSGLVPRTGSSSAHHSGHFSSILVQSSVMCYQIIAPPEIHNTKTTRDHI